MGSSRHATTLGRQETSAAACKASCMTAALPESNSETREYCQGSSATSLPWGLHPKHRMHSEPATMTSDTQKHSCTSFLITANTHAWHGMARQGKSHSSLQNGMRRAGPTQTGCMQRGVCCTCTCSRQGSGQVVDPSPAGAAKPPNCIKHMVHTAGRCIRASQA